MLHRSACLTERWQFRCNDAVISIAATPNCSTIAATTVGKSLYLLNSEGAELWKQSSLDNEGWSTAISADGTAIAVGTAGKNPAGGTVYIYNSQGVQIFAETLSSPVWSLSFSRDGTTLAANCWNGKAYKFIKEYANYRLMAISDSSPPSGLYGIKLARDGQAAYLCAYDSAIIVLDEKWQEQKRYDCANGGYNIDLAENGEVVVAGLRQGALLWIDLKNQTSRELKVSGCERPICGVSICGDGDLIVCGSFDGWVYLVNRTGIPLGRLETNGEVWSVVSSDDAARICIASGDHIVRFLENHCSVTPNQEICLCEDAASIGAVADVKRVLPRLVQLYSEYGVYEYGYSRLQIIQNQQSLEAATVFDEARNLLLKNAIRFSGVNHWAHYELGIMAQGENRHRDAISHFQHAARDSAYTSKAMIHCAASFSAEKLPTATAACYRRAREQQIFSDTKRVLYNLGSSYEDIKQWDGAISHFQLLASWDINYRDIWDRLEKMVSISKSFAHPVEPAGSDFTSLTIGLIGPNAPKKDIADELKNVLQARTAEILIQPGERERVARIIQELRSNQRFCRGITGTGLDYDQELFLKYDYALPEDETKKFLETVNLLYLLGESVPQVALDIGSATGRYPMLMRWAGAESYGLDIEPSAIEYATAQVEEEGFPKYIVGDARNLPFKSPKFDLVTCMMGTFAHVPRQDQQGTLNQMFDALLPGGHLAVSTWDMDCSHLAYLSIYNERQKDLIRENSPSFEGMRELLTQAGFQEVQIRPFCMLPQIAVYDLGLEDLRSGDIQLAAQADLAVRSLYPDKHGEMFIAFGRK
jgi:SAM-dependent methyltransferase/tetratricopeptide (TPR) repeat protein